MLKRVGMLSGGEASWAAMKLDAQRRGVEGLVLLFTDTKEEDADTYRFLDESAANISAPLVKASDGRRLWEVFKDSRMIGNTRADICSRVLKREVADRWLQENCDPQHTVVLLGYHIEEVHRFKKAKARYAANGWECQAPLCEQPYMAASEIKAWARREGLEEQRLYKLGFLHANCGGFCVKAGHAHFEHLLKTLPEVYRRHEQEEEAMRQYLGKDVAILRDRRGGRTRPLPMREFRERFEQGEKCDPFDWGGCGCFSGED